MKTHVEIERPSVVAERCGTRATTARVLLCLALSVSASPVFASDTCLVGRWEPVGNGAAEWMQRNAPGMNIAVHNQQGGIEFRADGRYVAGSTADVEASGADGKRAATRDASFRAEGAWSAEGGALTLRPSRESTSGRMEIAGPGGRTISVPMPSGASAPQRMDYTCAGETLETSVSIPGGGAPLVQRYRRASGR